jgi:hypothetical protein
VEAENRPLRRVVHRRQSPTEIGAEATIRVFRPLRRRTLPIHGRWKDPFPMFLRRASLSRPRGGSFSSLSRQARARAAPHVASAQAGAFRDHACLQLTLERDQQFPRKRHRHDLVRVGPDPANVGEEQRLSALLAETAPSAVLEMPRSHSMSRSGTARRSGRRTQRSRAGRRNGRMNTSRTSHVVASSPMPQNAASRRIIPFFRLGTGLDSRYARSAG